ncbi:hypothetical protein BDV93DRAFT_560953 [Ceratobasidium sp. AG-I]|nr:hypothetical protein BDV93DRAFT_560953 [Ceratobasidium sp. AG-I]
MERMNVDFEQPDLIAKHMPKLQYLYIGLSLRDWSVNSSLPRDCSSPSPCHIDSLFAFQESDIDMDNRDFDKEINDLARGSHNIWPRGAYCGFENRDYDIRKKGDLTVLERLNEIIGTLNATSVLPIPTAEKSSSYWLYSSW